MFSVNLNFDKTLLMQFGYLFCKNRHSWADMIKFQRKFSIFWTPGPCLIFEYPTVKRRPCKRLTCQNPLISVKQNRGGGGSIGDLASQKSGPLLPAKRSFN